MRDVTLPLDQLYAPIADDMRIVEQVFDDALVSDLPFVNDLCDTVRSYRGKMLRPALVLLSGRACGGINDNHHVLAAVVEMVHMATLLHDDVLDQADRRRKQPTVASISGNVAAVLLGDYLISRAFHLCTDVDDQHASRRIGAATNTVCEGELLQNALRGDGWLNEATYFQIIRDKTAALTAVACELGAHYAGAAPKVVESMRAFGEVAGIAFQVVDDVLDVVGETEDVGKSLGVDLSLGTLTLPTIHCLMNGPSDVASAIRDAAIERCSPPRDELQRLLRSTGSIEYAVSVARAHVSQALAHLSEVPAGDAKNSLLAMAEFIVSRHF